MLIVFCCLLSLLLFWKRYTGHGSGRLWVSQIHTISLNVLNLTKLMFLNRCFKMTPYNCKEKRRNLVFPPLSVIRCGCLIKWIIVCIVCIVLLHLEDNLILFWGPGQECWDWGWGVVPPGVDVSHTSVCSKWGRVCVLWWYSVKIHTRRSKQESNISLAKKPVLIFLHNKVTWNCEKQSSGLVTHCKVWQCHI